MGTYQEMQDRINLDYLNRTDMGDRTKRAIKNAILDYESRRYWFNETSTAITTVAGSSLLAVPTDLIALDILQMTYSGSTNDLKKDTFDNILRMNATSATGTPTHFAQRGDNFNLAIVPDSAYAVTAYYHQKLPELVVGDDSNAWVTEAANVIAHKATIEMMTTVLHVADPDRINYHITLLVHATMELNARNSVRLNNKLKATKF